MDFRKLTVKECSEDPELFAVVEKYVPNIKRLPIKLYNRKTLGELFDMVVKQKLVPEELAKKIGAELNEILDKR